MGQGRLLNALVRYEEVENCTFALESVLERVFKFISGIESSACSVEHLTFNQLIDFLGQLKGAVAIN